MKTKKLGIISFGLWIITIGFLGYSLYFGKTSKSIDGRTAINLTEAERLLVLTEMRALLVSVNGILAGLAEGDSEKSVEAAASSGMAMVKSLENEEKKILLKLPIEFKKLGMGTHDQFDAIAAKLKQKQDTKLILKEMDLLTQKCISCHAGYKIELENTKK